MVQLRAVPPVGLKTSLQLITDGQAAHLLLAKFMTVSSVSMLSAACCEVWCSDPQITTRSPVADCATRAIPMSPMLQFPAKHTRTSDRDARVVHH
jgi:hypothetical protein